MEHKPSHSEHEPRHSDHEPRHSDHDHSPSEHEPSYSDHEPSHPEHQPGPSASGHNSRSLEHQRGSSEQQQPASSMHEEIRNRPSNELNSPPGTRPVRPKPPQRTLTLREAMTREDILDPITAAVWTNRVQKQEWEIEKREQQEWKRREAEKLRNMSYWEHLKVLLCFRLRDEDMPHYTFCVGERGGCWMVVRVDWLGARYVSVRKADSFV